MILDLAKIGQKCKETMRFELTGSLLVHIYSNDY